ncbi:MAG: type II toxin-antitoxin system prevent-host-death family antitoxin [Gammaproteobacteria bacterium]|nr:MAG: type II toxin-antitoxin system prevent-host-death family antitoxin [Gammaproteobacteria bacterium]
MTKRVSATDAKNNFGGLLEDVAALGRVDIVRHGRLVAVVLSPRALETVRPAAGSAAEDDSWGRTHMIPPELARAARIVGVPDSFDDDQA